MKNRNTKFGIYTLVTFLFTALLSCGQSSNNTNEKAAGAPDVDIHTAVISGNLDVVKQHIEAGSDLNAPDPFGGSSPLITASLFGQPEIAKELLDAGVKVNFTNNEGSTALHTAAFFCKKEMVHLLIMNGADKSIRNNYGATALESVAGPFADVKPIYEMMKQQLSPMGVKVDMEYIEKTRPEIVTILQ
ncbi:MAG: ankyrin repeat domain-containing protein [Marinoscillum sp.]